MNESIMLIMIFTLNKRETGFFFYPKFHIMHPMFRLIQINSTNLVAQEDFTIHRI